jgi:hypothetical protein
MRLSSEGIIRALPDPSSHRLRAYDAERREGKGSRGPIRKNPLSRDRRGGLESGVGEPPWGHPPLRPWPGFGGGVGVGDGVGVGGGVGGGVGACAWPPGLGVGRGDVVGARGGSNPRGPRATRTSERRVAGGASRCVPRPDVRVCASRESEARGCGAASE